MKTIKFPCCELPSLQEVEKALVLEGMIRTRGDKEKAALLIGCHVLDIEKKLENGYYYNEYLFTQTVLKSLLFIDENGEKPKEINCISWSKLMEFVRHELEKMEEA